MKRQSRDKSVIGQSHLKFLGQARFEANVIPFAHIRSDPLLKCRCHLQSDNSVRLLGWSIISEHSCPIFMRWPVHSIIHLKLLHCRPDHVQSFTGLDPLVSAAPILASYDVTKPTTVSALTPSTIGLAACFYSNMARYGSPSCSALELSQQQNKYIAKLRKVSWRVRGDAICSVDSCVVWDSSNS